MSGISGPSQENYNSEANYRGGVRVFKAALSGYQKSTFKEQKEEYKKALDESHQVILESAARLGKSHLAKFKEDYQAFQASDTPEHIKALEGDISSLESNVS